jgi:hypothetical protein
MDKELLEAIEKQNKLTAEVMEQAATLRLTVADLETRNQQMGQELKSLQKAHYNNAKLMQSRLLSQWGLRVRYARAMHLLFESKFSDGKEKMYTFDGCGPYKSVSDTPRELLSVGEWVLIWYEVEKRVTKRYQMFAESIKRIRESEKRKEDEKEIK